MQYKRESFIHKIYIYLKTEEEAIYCQYLINDINPLKFTCFF